jgi:hypothetical protein
VTRYQIFLTAVIVLWPLVITGMLFLMSRIELYVARSEAENPVEAGLEPVRGDTGEKEVRIVFGDQVVTSPPGT